MNNVVKALEKTQKALMQSIRTPEERRKAMEKEQAAAKKVSEEIKAEKGK